MRYKVEMARYRFQAVEVEAETESEAKEKAIFQAKEQSENNEDEFEATNVEPIREDLSYIG